MTDWTQAQCVGTDPAVIPFDMPDGSVRPGRLAERFRPALALCARCSITGACLAEEPLRLERLERFTRTGGRPIEQPCGTIAAYRRHYAHGERACESCRAAYNGRRRVMRTAGAA